MAPVEKLISERPEERCVCDSLLLAAASSGVLTEVSESDPGKPHQPSQQCVRGHTGQHLGSGPPGPPRLHNHDAVRSFLPLSPLFSAPTRRVRGAALAAFCQACSGRIREGLRLYGGTLWSWVELTLRNNTACRSCSPREEISTPALTGGVQGRRTRRWAVIIFVFVPWFLLCMLVAPSFPVLSCGLRFSCFFASCRPAYRRVRMGVLAWRTLLPGDVPSSIDLPFRYARAGRRMRGLKLCLLLHVFLAMSCPSFTFWFFIAIRSLSGQHLLLAAVQGHTTRSEHSADREDVGPTGWTEAAAERKIATVRGRDRTRFINSSDWIPSGETSTVVPVLQFVRCKLLEQDTGRLV
jgi:hypothetical protein